jgi:hypothetical protein
MLGTPSMEPLSTEVDTVRSFTFSLKRPSAHEPMLASADNEGHADEYRQKLTQQHEQWQSATKRLQLLREKQALTKQRALL